MVGGEDEHWYGYCNYYAVLDTKRPMMILFDCLLLVVDASDPGWWMAGVPYTVYCGVVNGAYTL